MSYKIEVVELKAQPVMVMEARTAPENLGEVLGRIFPAVYQHVSQQQGQITGMPFVRYLDMDGQFTIEAGMPTAESMAGTDEIFSRELPAGRAATTLFLGEYHRVGEAWDAINAWCADNGFDVSFGGWDIYENDPTEVSDPSEFRTRLYQPLS